MSVASPIPSPYAPPITSCYVDSGLAVWIQGGIVSGIVYGGVALLSFFCLQLLWRNEGPGFASRTAKNRALLIYVGFMYFFATLILASNMQTVFVGVRDWCSNMRYNPLRNSLGTLGDVSYVLANWLADALLIWRCMIIYKGARYPLWAISMPPIILFLTSFGTGVLFLCYPDGSGNVIGVHASRDENVQSIHACVTLSLNILVTVMIVSRLALYRSRIVSVLGKKHGTPYTGVIAMIVESQIIVLVFGIVLVAELFEDAGQGGGTLLAYQIAAQVQIFAPLLQIFRVAQGKAWCSQTFDQVTTGITTSERKPISTIRFGSTPEQGRSSRAGVTTITFQEDRTTREVESAV